MSLSPPRDLSHHHSIVLRRAGGNVMKKFYKYFGLPGMGNLAGGLPDPAYFPYDSLEAEVALPDRFEPTPNESAASLAFDDKSRNRHRQLSHSHLTIPHDSPEPDRTRKIDLSTALQYGTADGYPPLRVWVTEFVRTKIVPQFPYRGGPSIVLTDGNTDGFAKVLNALSDVWDNRKDWLRDRQGLLCEEFVFPPPKQLADARGLNTVPVAVDQEGMTVEGPGGLRDILENWDRSKGRRPHLMYTITVGQNPTGGVLSIERKRKIYELCQKFDIIIIEDDPYWYLQFPSASRSSIAGGSGPSALSQRTSDTEKATASTDSPFIDSLVPSYLTIDVDGRVLRLDTFSKTIAPGCRLGWITGQPALVDGILGLTDLMTQQPSGFVQSMVAELILGQQSVSRQGINQWYGGETSGFRWQTEGWVRWLEGLRGNYEKKMLTMANTLEAGKYKINSSTERHSWHINGASPDGFEVVSKTQVLDFNYPAGGMFLWLRMCFENHPLYGHPKVSNEDMWLACWLFMISAEYKVLAAPGHFFAASEGVAAEKGWQYLRLCFAFLPEDGIKAVTENLVRSAHSFFAIDDPQEILEIIENDPLKDQGTAARLGVDPRNFSTPIGC